MIKQYNDLKAKHPDAVLLFRVGDFYRSISDDARIVSSVCGVTLAKDEKAGTWRCEFPHYNLDVFLPKLVRAGHRLAICDPLEAPVKEEDQL